MAGRTDISQAADAERIMESAQDAFGKLDILVGNLVSIPWTLIENTDPAKSGTG